MAAVAARRAEVCAIDCVSYAIAARHRPSLTAALRELAVSPQLPALPYVTSPRRDADEVRRLRAALFAALADPALAAALEAIFLAGAEVLPAGAYDRIKALEAEAPRFVIPAKAGSDEAYPFATTPDWPPLSRG
jgi:ABC-type phosphate/phosphonate transport system substrate-binding protein